MAPAVESLQTDRFRKLCLPQRKQTNLFADADEDAIVETGPLVLLGYLPTIVSGVNLLLFRTLGVR